MSHNIYYVKSNMPVRQYESICISIQYNILRCDDSAIVNNFSINVIGSLASGAQPRQIACPFPAGSSNPREYDVETYLKSAGIISGNRASFLKHKSVWSFDSGRNSRAGVISAHPHEHSPLEHCPHISRLMSVIFTEKTQGNLSGTIVPPLCRFCVFLSAFSACRQNPA